MCRKVNEVSYGSEDIIFRERSAKRVIFEVFELAFMCKCADLWQFTRFQYFRKENIMVKGLESVILYSVSVVVHFCCSSLGCILHHRINRQIDKQD